MEIEGMGDHLKYGSWEEDLVQNWEEEEIYKVSQRRFRARMKISSITYAQVRDCFRSKKKWQTVFSEAKLGKDLVVKKLLMTLLREIQLRGEEVVPVGEWGQLILF